MARRITGRWAELEGGAMVRFHVMEALALDCIAKVHGQLC
jgi:hypothetical protein